MSESYSYENLFAGDQKPPVNRPATFRLSEVVSRGALVGRLTSTGKWQTPDFDDVANFSDFGIAAEDIDSTSGEVISTVYCEGEFAESGVTFPYSHTADDWRETLAGHGIYLRSTMSTAGIG